MMEVGRGVADLLNFLTTFHIQLLIFGLIPCWKRLHEKRNVIRFLLLAVPYMAGWYFFDVHGMLRMGGVGFGFVLYFFWLVLILKYSFELPFLCVFFHATSAYAVQHMLYWFKYCLENLYFPEGRNLAYFSMSFGVMVMIGVLYYVIFIRHYEKSHNEPGDDKASLLFSMFTIFMVSIFSQVPQSTPLAEMVIYVGVYAGLCCILLLVIQYRIFDVSRIQREKEIVEQLLYESEKQRRTFKESMDIINLKCHDLKHQISAIKYIDSPSERRQFIEEAEKATTFLGVIAKTGNETLDVVLTEKCLQAEKYQIQLTYIADGSLLGFFSIADLSAFFGNILDNAIESVKDVDVDRRIIFFSVDRRAEHVYIHVENWCDKELVFEDGFPMTTKKDKDYHGYGIASLRLIAEKYDAQLRMELRDNMFYTDALFPYQGDDTDK